MDELRWILLIVGVLILAGIYFFADPTKIRTPERLTDPDDVAPVDRSGPLDGEVSDEAMERELQRLGELISEERRGGSADGVEAGEPGEPVITSEPEKVVALYLRPPGDHRLSGGAVLDAADKVGLSYGDMQIFHRLQEISEQNVAVFSLADMLSPGSFNINAMDTSSTPGLCLFMTLPNPLSALDAWDAMLATGQRLADILEADLLDESHSSLSRQRIAHIREEMREFDRRSEFQLPR